ncbi:unnamed protein product [Triticum turgidum subsp. durum]|uniref:Uncharacterized protein n=1 Tax=Triticum turgidum subsp. durum TaxID=4567 RepID=A0A9R0WVM7_TRITD|nr:unnamed protein product [Triticum turgidum subsp. durum]
MPAPLIPIAAATAAATSAVGVALGVRLLLLLSRSRALKPLAATTSAAAAALRAPRVLAAASSLLAASKAASKSYKAARALDPAARLPSLPSSKRVKAAFAAASLLRLAPTLLLLPAAASSPSPTALFALALLKSGYKLSKNSAKVVEGFLGLQVHKGFRNGVDALGVVVKVAVIASEVAVWVGGRFWGADDDGRGRSVRFLGLTRTTTLVLAGSAKSEAQVVLFDPGTVVEMEDEGCWLEEDPDPSLLLCLAVPLPA